MLNRIFTHRIWSKINPNYTEYLTSMKLPRNPRIVLYTEVDRPEAYLQQVLPQFYLADINVKQSTTDEAAVSNIAQEINSADKQPLPYSGFLIRGFPYNPKQAFLLDQLTNGVNLAIHLKKNANANSEFDNSIKEMLGYYNDRGNLVTFNYNENLTPSEAEDLWHQVIANIKVH